MSDYTEPTLFEDLEAAVETVTNVAPALFDRAHTAGDLIVQHPYGHFAMESLPCRSEGPTAQQHSGAWVFLDMGSTLNVLTCRVHGNSIDSARARALGEHLIAWANRKDGAA